TLVVNGVGKVHLLGIKSAEQSAVELGPTGSTAEPRREPPTTPAISGSIHLSRGRPSRDLLRKLALGKMVHIEYDSLVGSNSGRAAYLFLDDGTLLNAEMLKAGQARVDPTRQFVRETEFKRLEAEAQSAAIGIWIR
ncbi:MAG TPA: thermonuclease family protein, partial [Vicinamibacterales bacterium]|nr:thermonuclease family protein [Vicinamibacterales bacterium]